MTNAEERAHSIPLGEFDTCPHKCVSRMHCGDCSKVAPAVDALISDRRKKALKAHRIFKQTDDVPTYLLKQLTAPIGEDPVFWKLAHHPSTCVHHEIALRMKRIERAAELLEVRKVIADKQEAWETIVPPGYRNTRLDSLPNQDITRCVMGFARRDTPPGVLAFGPVGTGKTRTCLMLLRKWMFDSYRADWSFKFIEGAAIDDAAKAHARSGGMGDWINELLQTDALMIDDIGHGNFSPSYADALRRVLERATSHRIPVLVTCQYDAKALLKQWAGAEPSKVECVKAIIRRLAEFCRPVRFSKNRPPEEVKP